MNSEILISIDDTDEIGTKGTGEILEDLLSLLETRFSCKWSPVTRHQLLISDVIAYTSHNSSMCSTGIISEFNKLEIIDFCEKFLRENVAPGSDPGFCLISLENLEKEDMEKLICYGKSAKVKVLNKDEAYSLAAKLNVYLNELGGTGLGVIGALAGAGLRLSGNDGRFKGKIKINDRTNFENECVLVKDLLNEKIIDEIREFRTNKIISPEAKVFLNGNLKTVFIDFKAVFYVVNIPGSKDYRNINKKENRIF